MGLQSIQALEDTVVEELLAQLIPDVLYRVEFWRIGRQAQQVNVVRGFELGTAVPASAIDNHDDLFVRMTLRDFVEKQLHAPRVDMWQHQTVEFASTDIDSAKDVGVFVRQHSLAYRPHRLGSPAAAHIRDAPKTRLVLKHQLDFSALGPFETDFGERFGEFFFHSC